MNDDIESVQILEDIIKKGAIKFRDEIGTNIECSFIEKEEEDEKDICFNLYFGEKHEYQIALKKFKTENDDIPDVKGYNKMDLTTNPFKKLKFTDESDILGNIFDALKSLRIDEIACYEKNGIIMKNPLNLKGIYNINIKYLNG